MMTRKTQTMIVMRHALRLDEVDASFVTSSSTWWDPPLAKAGFEQVRHHLGYSLCQGMLQRSATAQCGGAGQNSLERTAVFRHTDGRSFTLSAVFGNRWHCCQVLGNRDQ